MPTQSSVAALLEQHSLGYLTGEPQSVGGGDSTPTFALQTSQGQVFGKRVASARIGQLRCEANSLIALERTRSVRVPQVIACDVSDDEAWLLLEWLDIRPLRGSQFETLARNLSDLHRVDAAQFGWPEDNWIGNTPQVNRSTRHWMTFYRECRLIPQITMAEKRGMPASLRRLADALLGRLPDWLDAHVPQVSLTHGDLWVGNTGMADRPVVYDPACFFGDREMDLAMAQLFGGFDPGFFSAYHEAWPLPPASQQRVGLYQIYHQLNHLNLFGGAYLGACERTIRRLLDAL